MTIEQQSIDQCCICRKPKLKGWKVCAVCLGGLYEANCLSKAERKRAKKVAVL